jgi:hypothetical protein
MTKIQRLRNRRIDPEIKTDKEPREVYDLLKDEEDIVYTIGTMQPLDREQTAVYFSESRRLQQIIGYAAGIAGIATAFRYHGPILTDTHISFRSDFELLVINMNFITLESPQKAAIPFGESPLDSLRILRNLSIEAIKTTLPECEVDTSDAISVKLSGEGMARDIQLIFANWFNTNEYVKSRQEKYRGLTILDSEGNRRRLSLPFFHNSLIAEKDERSGGAARKLIRLINSLLFDAGEKNGLSDYDIASLIWNMPERNLSYGHGQEIQLVNSGYDYLIYVLTNEAYRTNLMVPNGTRRLFDSDGATKNQLKVTTNHLGVLVKDINQALHRSSRDLATALIAY